MASFKSTHRGRKGSITFQLYGDWVGVQQRLNALPKELKSSAEWGQRKAAEKYALMVKNKILSGDVRPPKQVSNLDSRPLINTSVYVNAIRAWRKNYVYYVGIPAGEKHPTSKLADIATLARLHEFGNKSRGIPARPVWGPVWEEFGGTPEIKRIIVRAIKNKISKMEIPGFEIRFKDIF